MTDTDIDTSDNDNDEKKPDWKTKPLSGP